jgi:hypothetical protein
MSRRTDSINAVVVLSAGALLAACGGGGGGGGGGGDSVTTSSNPVTISASNAPDVAAASYKTTAGLEGGGGGATGFLTGAVAQTNPGGIDLVDVLISQVKEVPQLASAEATATLTGAVISQTVDCFNGGSISFSFDDANNDQQLSNGESLSFTANNCTEDGMVMNGSVSVSNITVSGDPVTALPYSMQFSMQVNNFSVTEGAESVALNGGMTLSEASSDGILFTRSISGNSIQVTEGGVTASLSNFSIAASENENTLAFTLDLNATVNSSELGGSVTMVTDTVFEGFALDYPSVGQATITGANNTSVTLIALDSVNVRLQIDADGDAVAETIVDTTWDAL